MNNHKTQNIIKSLSNINSNKFFDEICLSLSESVAASFVFIAKLDESKTEATSIAIAHKGQIIENFSYALQNTPCKEVANESLCTHSQNIQQLYPEDQLLIDMGIEGYVGIPLKTTTGDVGAILVALFEEEIDNLGEVEALFLLFSGLIEKELHKVNYLKKISFYQDIIENAHEAILLCDKNQLITYINPAFTVLTGYTQNDVKGKTPKILSSGRQSSAFYQAMWAEMNKNGHWQGEIWNKRKDGTEYLEWLSITVMLDENNEISHYNAFISNITKQHEAIEKIKFQDLYDALTKAPNKKALFKFIEQSIVNFYNPFECKSAAALLVIDIDLFQKFNSLYSHALGDKVLIHVANTLQSIVRGNDIVSRTNGDHFALFANHLNDKDSIIHIIDKIYNSFNQPFIIDGITIKITLSIGIAYFGNDATDAHSLFEKAEEAMFVSKDNGRNSYGFYSKQISDKAIKAEQLRLSLERAIENDEFSLVYQPIISLQNQSVTKFEVLIRWDNNGTFVSPVEFIPAAEKYGLITKIGEIVLNKACIALKNLKNSGFTNIVFNVNRSIYEFPLESHDFSWIDTIKKHNLNPNDICFELTESVLAPENDSYIALLNKLQVAGCTIALDDFGTGYSSLSYLRRFPINTLKIDRSFISDMTKVKGDAVLVSAIISMAKALGITVVAEGVELKQEVDMLAELGCDYIQGYYFSKPLKLELLNHYLLNFDFNEF